jgi:hypothetical protein
MRWIEIEQRGRRIVAADKGTERQAFNHDAGQAIANLSQQRAKLGDVEARRTTLVDAEVASRDPAAEGQALTAQIEGSLSLGIDIRVWLLAQPWSDSWHCRPATGLLH